MDSLRRGISKARTTRVHSTFRLAAQARAAALFDGHSEFHGPFVYAFFKLELVILVF